MENKKQVAVKELAVTQSNSLVEAIYPRVINQNGKEVEIDVKVSTRAHKVSRLIASLISPKDDNLRLYRVEISTLKNYLGYKQDFPNGKFYQDLRDIANRLNKQPIEIRPEPKRVITAYFISSFELNFKTGEIIFEISSQLRPYLLQLKDNFTSFQLENIPKLSSSYSIRLYEILCQYKNIGKRTFHNIDDLQKMIGSAYEQYGHFKARVLDPTQKDLTKNTDITFDLEEVKKGRRVEKLIFHIKENIPTNSANEKQLSLTFGFRENAALNAENDNDLYAVLESLGIIKEKIAEYVALGFGIIKDEKKRLQAEERCNAIHTYYNEKISLLRASKPEMENPAGFFIKALQEDWQTSKAIKEVSNQKQLKEHREKQACIKQLEKQSEQKKKEFIANQEPVFQALAADETIFNEAYTAVMLSVGNSSYLKKIVSDNGSPQKAYKNSMMLKGMIDNYFFNKHTARFESFKAFELEYKAIVKELSELKTPK